MVYTERLGYSFIFQGELGLVIDPSPKITGGPEFRRPLLGSASIFTGFILNTRLILFGNLNYSPEFINVPWADDNRRYRRQSALHAGGGIQLIYSERFSCFLSYRHVVYSEYQGGANSLSLNLRFSNQ
ncbi:MAG: hypothetical protein AAFY41_18910 [Bacteroidota bacterium]